MNVSGDKKLNFFNNKTNTNLITYLLNFISTKDKLNLSTLTRTTLEIISNKFNLKEVIEMKDFIYTLYTEKKNAYINSYQPSNAFFSSIYKNISKITESSQREELQNFMIKVICNKFRSYLKRIKIYPVNDIDYYRGIIRISRLINYIEIVRISNTELNDNSVNTLLALLTNTDSIKELEIVNLIKFKPNYFDMINKSLINSAITVLKIEKINLQEHSFGFLISCINSSQINYLSLKRLSFSPGFDFESQLEKLILENELIKKFEFSLSINNENVQLKYNNILNLVLQNKNIYYFNIEDYTIENENFSQVLDFYQQNLIYEHKKTLIINENLSPNYKEKLLELYLEHKPELYYKLEMSDGAYQLIYEGLPPNASRIKIEIRNLSLIENSKINFYEEIIKKYEISTVVLHVSNYLNIRNFFKFLKEKDCFEEIVLNNQKSDELFIGKLSEFLYSTKKVKRFIINTPIQFNKFSSEVFLAILNNKSLDLYISIDISYDEYLEIVKFIEDKNVLRDFSININRELVSKEFKKKSISNVVIDVKHSIKILDMRINRIDL